MPVFWTYYCNMIVFIMVFCKHEENTTEIKACQDINIYVGSNKNKAKVVDVTLGATVHLDCHFCGENGSFEPKNWYFKRRGSNKTMKEIIEGIETECGNHKVSVTPLHTLNVKDFNMYDSGIYTCKPFSGNEDGVFAYVLDGVFNDNIMPKSGMMAQWQEYKRTNIDAINKKFIKPQQKPFLMFVDAFKFSFRLIIVWEDWGPCHSNGRRKGVRKRLGRCRLQPIPLNSSREDIFEDDFITNMTSFYLVDDYDVSCRSIRLHDFFPEISKLLRKIPEFQMIEHCKLKSYNPATDKAIIQKKSFKYETTMQIAENGHVILMCPDITWESKVDWYKNKEILNSSFRNNMAATEEEPHLTIDLYNSLYVFHATKDEEGVYACKVNGINMKEFHLKIVSKSKILNQEFLRYSIYLGFVLSLTITCYCAGVCVAWHRRSSFVDPLNLNVKN